MYYVGVGLHKKSITVCVVELVVRERKIIERRKFFCDQEEQMAEYFANLGQYQLVVEATASYEWFVQLVEPTADRVVLAQRRAAMRLTCVNLNGGVLSNCFLTGPKHGGTSNRCLSVRENGS